MVVWAVTFRMSRNASSSPANGGEGNQPELSDFITPECPVCGRLYADDTAPCHADWATGFERRLATTDWIASNHRYPDPDPGKRVAVRADGVPFECLYLALQSAIDSGVESVQQYREVTPYQIPVQEWIAPIFRDYVVEGDDLRRSVEVAVSVCEARVEQRLGRVAPEAVFAHMVYLDQFGLLPGYDRLEGGEHLHAVLADEYELGLPSGDTEWVVRRRVDRSVVYSTTPEFRETWDLDLTPDLPESHVYAGQKPFCGEAVLGDHRDHNLVVQRAKRSLSRRPNVDWTVAPHTLYSRAGYSQDDEAPSGGQFPVLSFDFAGFEHVPAGPRLRYLGVVADWEESPVEVYQQLVQLAKTDATGLLVMCNRQAIYDFLHFLQANELVSVTAPLPDKRDGYTAIPNVRALHEAVLDHIPLFTDVVVLPRRKLLDEGLHTIDELVAPSTDA